MAPALNKAITERRFKQALLFIKSGVNANSKGPNGKTALLQICEVEPENLALVIARALLQNGAKIEIKDRRGRNAFMSAILHERNKLVTYFLEAAGNFNLNAKDNEGNTALFHAATIGNFNIVRKIVHAHKKFRLSVDIPNKEGVTPLIQASRNGHLLCAQHLLSEGKASKEIRDNKHWKTATEWTKPRNCWLDTLELRDDTENARTEKRAKSSQIAAKNINFNVEYDQRPHTAPTRQLRSHRDELSALFQLYQYQLSGSYRPGSRTAEYTDEKPGRECKKPVEDSRKDSIFSKPLLTRRKSSLLKTKGQEIMKLQKRDSTGVSPLSGGRRISQSFPGTSMDKAALVNQLSAAKRSLGQVRPEAGLPRPPVRSKSVMPSLKLHAIAETENSEL